MLIPCSLTRGLMTGPPLINVSLLANAISFLSLMASIVGWRPAAPTIPVTTVSAESTVAQARIPSSPCMISGRSDLGMLASSNKSTSSCAACGVAKDATFGLNLRTCSAMSLEFVPADNASTTKLSGQTSTMSSVCVPIEPVEPNNDNRFLNSAPSNDFSSVSFNDASLSTGADGSIQPSPVPVLPDFIFDEGSRVDEDNDDCCVNENDLTPTKADAGSGADIAASARIDAG
mmetsp:Transcript_58805/g.143844  ORF Transcript_58805/g.143844 Transcript_58805/m.143844 type:complete len:232 (+) Transcript_58805:1054-1749(+)